jgi:hypothetical protein
VALLCAGALDLTFGAAGAGGRLVAAAALGLLAVKLVLEGVGAARPTNLPAGVAPATTVHLAGATAGSLAWLLVRRRRGGARGRAGRPVKGGTPTPQTAPVKR